MRATASTLAHIAASEAGPCELPGDLDQADPPQRRVDVAYRDAQHMAGRKRQRVEAGVGLPDPLLLGRGERQRQQECYALNDLQRCDHNSSPDVAFTEVYRSAFRINGLLNICSRDLPDL